MQREVRNVIFTNHALDRLDQRQITQHMVVQTVQSPDRSEIERDGDTKFTKTINGRQLQVIGRWEADENKWLVKSAWVRGEEEQKRQRVPAVVGAVIALVYRLFRLFMNNRRRR